VSKMEARLVGILLYPSVLTHDLFHENLRLDSKSMCNALP
jgi:hypothetical protein